MAGHRRALTGVILCVAAVALVAAGPAAADHPPEATVTAVVNTSDTTAVLNAKIDPSAFPNLFDQVEYATTGSTFCNSEGVTGAYSATPLTADSATQQQSVSVTLGGLVTGTEYCTALVLSQHPAPTGLPPGQFSSSLAVFLAGGPNVDQTLITQPVNTTSERVSGTINPLGSATTYTVESGSGGAVVAERESPWCQTAGVSGSFSRQSEQFSLPSAATPEPFSVVMTGLRPGHGYCWAVAAQNAAGTSPAFSIPGEFGGTGVSYSFVAGKPSVSTRSFTHLRSRAVILHGTFNGSGDTNALWEFSYGRRGSAFCRAHGALISSRKTVNRFLKANTATHRISAHIRGLRPHTRYCYEADLLSSEPSGLPDNYYKGRLRFFRTS